MRGEGWFWINQLRSFPVLYVTIHSIPFINTDIHVSVDHVMEIENLVWVQTELVSDDEKLLFKFHWPNYYINTPSVV